MRVVIPKGIYYKDKMVDIHLATPYGLSPALQVPVLDCPATPATPTPTYGYSIAADKQTVTAVCRVISNGTQRLVALDPAPLTTSWRINWSEPTGSVEATASKGFGGMGQDLGGRQR